jgi:hypothetical protein
MHDGPPKQNHAGVSWVPRRADHELCRAQLTGREPAPLLSRLPEKNSPRGNLPGLNTDPQPEWCGPGPGFG